MESEEKIIWEGSPSQWLNFNTFCLCMFMSACVAIAVFSIGPRWWVFLFFFYPAGKAVFAWIELFSVKYKLTSQKFVFRNGIFNRYTKEFDLKEIREVELNEPWYERIVKLGDIKLHFHSYSDLDIKLAGISDPKNVMKKFNQTLKQYSEITVINHKDI